MDPPRARGSGRSGPRRRTGCLTCRSRKVRCDETKPECANCTRLRLGCVYNRFFLGTAIPRRRSHRSVASPTATPPPPPVPVAVPPPQLRSQPELPPAPMIDPCPHVRPGINFLQTVLRADEEQCQNEHLRQPESGVMMNERSQHGPDLEVPFDMLSFIGEITSELGQKQMDLTNGISDFISPTPPSMVTTNGGLSERGQTPMTSPSVGDGIMNHASIENFSKVPEMPIPSGNQTPYEEQLLIHFLRIKSPPMIFGPVNVEWTYVQPALLAQSLEFNPLLNAIYCYADVHKAMAEGKLLKMAPTYYRMASSEIQECILGDVSDLMLKRVFTAVFLLMLSEVLSSPDLCRPGTSFLHSAYLLLQRFHSRTKSWTGMSHLVVSWISLLDVKALIAGRDGDPLIELCQLSGSGTDDMESNGPLFAREAKEEDNDLSKPGYLIYEAIMGPVFRFFVQTQQVIRRIVCIDLHHRSRGTLSDEFEVLQIAHEVGADLETLWNRRPPVLDVYDQPEELLDTLSPSAAIEVCRSFRQYVANFLACFIYLHRVAFAIYPRTDRVHKAVDQIIQLARIETMPTGEQGEEQEQEKEKQQEQHHLPMSFIWPLFVAGLEGSLEQRRWIVQEIQRMAESERTHRHPNATQALMLLEEMTQRQDVSRTGADSRFVRRELFADSFVMI